MLPAITGSNPASDFVTSRSAFSLTVVSSVSELLPAVASAVVAETVAVLDRSAVREEFTFTVSVTVVSSPAASVPRLQVTESVMPL